MLIAFSLLLALSIIWLLASPHLGEGPQHRYRDQGSLQDHKERCVQVLKDLELDYSTEKISKEDYERTKRTLERELGALLAKLHPR